MTRLGNRAFLHASRAVVSFAMAIATLAWTESACAQQAASGGASDSTNDVSSGATSLQANERDERVVWTGEVRGQPAKLVMSPKEPTVNGIFLEWHGPVDRALGVVGGVVVGRRNDFRTAANFKIDGAIEPIAQLPLLETGVWKIEVTPPVLDAATEFAKPIAWSITVGETTMAEPPERRPIRAFFRRPEIRYTIMGVGFFLMAIIIIVQRYRG